MSSRHGRRRLGFGVMVVGVLYVLVSISIAIASSDTCGRDAPKDWQQFPVPHWECQSGFAR